VSTEYIYHPVSYYKERDSTKRELSKHNGISLIIVPCWWDGTKERLGLRFYSLLVP